MTLDQVKNSIKKVTDGDHSNVEGTEIAVEEDDTEMDFFREDHFTGVNHSATFSALNTLLNCKLLAEVSAATLDRASTMEFGKRDNGSMIPDRKLMSLNQR